MYGTLTSWSPPVLRKWKFKWVRHLINKIQSDYILSNAHLIHFLQQQTVFRLSYFGIISFCLFKDTLRFETISGCWKPFKNHKNTFNFFLNVLFVFLRNLNFCFNFFGHVEKWLDKNVNINFKTHDLRTREQKIAINIL